MSDVDSDTTNHIDGTKSKLESVAEIVGGRGDRPEAQRGRGAVKRDREKRTVQPKETREHDANKQ